MNEHRHAVEHFKPKEFDWTHASDGEQVEMMDKYIKKHIDEQFDKVIFENARIVLKDEQNYGLELWHRCRDAMNGQLNIQNPQRFDTDHLAVSYEHSSSNVNNQSILVLENAENLRNSSNDRSMQNAENFSHGCNSYKDSVIRTVRHLAKGTGIQVVLGDITHRFNLSPERNRSKTQSLHR